MNKKVYLTGVSFIYNLIHTSFLEADIISYIKLRSREFK